MTPGNFCFSLARLHPVWIVISSVKDASTAFPLACRNQTQVSGLSLATVPWVWTPAKWMRGVGRRWAHGGAEQHQRGWCTACAFYWHAVLHWRHCASPRYNPFQSSPQSSMNPHHPLINTVPRRHNWALSIATGFTYTLTCKLQIKVLNLSINCLFLFFFF